MEKLIELLNEYEKVREKSEYQKLSNSEYKWFSSYFFPLCFWHQDGISWAMTNEFHEWAEAVICSKSYWFIQWLVENEKIDLEKVKEKIWIPCFVWYKEWEISCVNDKEDYEQLLIALAIQDEPINFLISILK